MADVEIKGFKELDAALKRLGRVAPECGRRALGRCGLLAVREAKRNAPRSPTQKQFSATLKRKKRTARKLTPGGLEKSIEYEANESNCSVFVASNSFAGKYARRIHDEKGKTWRNRGPGTIAKGPRADDKFIERAMIDNRDKFTDIINKEVEKEIHRWM